ncbi:MAG: chalcone isomerase family protein [Bdellovibrionales bacterium]|nr:chalcone isomerase family protein [Bdellovibrionales bacterium]
MDEGFIFHGQLTCYGIAYLTQLSGVHEMCVEALKTRVPLILLACCILIAPGLQLSAQSEEIGGVSFRQSISMGDTPLVLNGVGLRTATIFGVKVYAMALYLVAKNQSDRAIIDDPSDKYVQMHFLRAVSAEKLQQAWIDGVNNNVETASTVAAAVNRFSQSMVDVEAGDVLTMHFKGDQIITALNGKKISEWRGSPLQKAILACWLGKSPPNSALKEGLLGRE